MLACKHALPAMREQRSGAIVNVSSIAAVCVGPHRRLQDARRRRSTRLTRALGNARYGIRVNAIMPGLIDTPMAIEGVSQARGIAKDDLRRARAPRCRSAKMGTAWDVARAALFLASDEARFITGVVLPVDGGRSSRIG